MNDDLSCLNCIYSYVEDLDYELCCRKHNNGFCPYIGDYDDHNYVKCEDFKEDKR